MKRSLVLGGVVVAAIVALVITQCGGRGATTASSTAMTTRGSATARTTVAKRDKHVDPRTLQRASISGVVTDLASKTPLAGARVCGDAASHQLSPQLVREPACATTDARGAYTLKDLVPAGYVVGASAPRYRPGVYVPDGAREPTTFVLTPGQARTGVDVALRPGGVEVTGTVSDVTGGPIAQALVRASAGWGDAAPLVETGADGRFALWSSPGRVVVTATAEGYGRSGDGGRAPGVFDIRLTPESSLAGTVVDAASGQPVAGVYVHLSVQDPSWADEAEPADVTDEHGAFRIARLTPGRYAAYARSPHGYGRGDGSTLVGLGQHVEGVVIRLHAAAHVSGKVIRADKSVCRQAYVTLTDDDSEGWARTRTDPDGQVHADGVLPGTYSVEVTCKGALAREKYDSIVVTDKDVTGLVWEVDAGAAVRGRVTNRRGDPIEGAYVQVRPVNNARDTSGDDGALADGTYVVSGLVAGTYEVAVKSDNGIAPPDGWKVELAAGATIDKDLVLADGGVVTGSVVDTSGKPIAGVGVHASPSRGGGSTTVRSATDGTFSFTALTTGDYRITATRIRMGILRRPGSTNDTAQGEKVTVTAGKTATVTLVVEAQSGRITGTVLDMKGAPVSDAYVIAARESDAAGASGSAVGSTRWNDHKPVITAVDGTFTITDLATSGRYTVRASIRGGGEVIAEHVPVGTTTKLQLKATASIAGTATSTAGPITDLWIALKAPKTGFRRHETFFRTGGAFSLRDLPPGTFTLTATTPEGKQQLELELAEGEARTGISLALDSLVTITGRVIDATTKQPVAGITMAAMPVKGGGHARWASDATKNTTGADGRFMIERAPSGSILLSGYPKDHESSAYVGVSTSKHITATETTIDVGDILVFKRRLPNGEKAGDRGFRLADTPPGASPDEAVFKVSYIDPQGPAAKSGLVVGDILISIDGHSIVGADHTMTARTLMAAPPGTTIVFGLERGASVSITLGPPP